MRIRWESEAPTRAAAWLGDVLGLTPEAVGGQRELALPNAVLEVGPLPPDAARNDDRLRLVEVSANPSGHPTARTGAVLLAVGIATVDIERFTADQNLILEPRPPDPILGARCVQVMPGPMLLEPNTEGRIAASLARFGEGPAALFLGVGSVGALEAVRDAKADRGLAVTAVRQGPFGPEFAIAAGPAWGPHIVVCASDVPPARTIAS